MCIYTEFIPILATFCQLVFFGFLQQQQYNIADQTDASECDIELTNCCQRKIVIRVGFNTKKDV